MTRLAPAVLAALALAPPALAARLVVEPAPLAPGRTVVVSWDVPHEYEESELLIVVEGGPRVRLTDEQLDPSPRVHVRLPSLVGTARFLVRAGRKGPDGRHREEDLARSEPFPLAIDPAGAGASLPVLAPSTRPDAMEETEWWAEEAAGRLGWPGSGLGDGARTRSGEVPRSVGDLPPTRHETAPSRDTGRDLAAPERRAAALPSEARPRERSFSGAQVPLRN